MAWSLSLTYFTVMGAKCALPSVLGLLLQDAPMGLQFHRLASSSTTKQQAMAQLLTFSTLAVAAGKLVLGPVIDSTGGRVFLQFTLALLAALFGYLGSPALCQGFTGFFVAWMGVDFLFSSCWASCLSAIHASFPSDRWANLIGNLATGARAGNAVAFAVFAQVLQATTTSHQEQPWRWVFGLSAVAQLVPLTMLMYASRRPEQARRVDDNDSDTTLSTMKARQQQQSTIATGNNNNDSSASCGSSSSSPLVLAMKEMKRLNFWMHFCSRSVLMVFASFLLFVPTYMCQAFGTSTARGSQTGSVYALGCLLAVTVGTRLYNAFVTGDSGGRSSTANSNSNSNSNNNKVLRRTRAKKKTLALSGMMVAAALSSALQWAHCSNRLVLSPVVGSCLFFLWGLAMAIPFYIPPSLYALQRGGTDCSATLMDLFDIGGFGLLATFNGYVAQSTGSSSSSTLAARKSAWSPTFAMTTACALLSLVTLGIASWREGRDTDVGDDDDEEHHVAL